MDPSEGGLQCIRASPGIISLHSNNHNHPDQSCSEQTSDHFYMNCRPSLQIILQASCPPSDDESFALDDVHIIRDRSCDYVIPTTTPNPPSTTTSAPASAMDCTFENGKQGKSGSVKMVNPNIWFLHFCKILSIFRGKKQNEVCTNLKIYTCWHDYCYSWLVIYLSKSWISVVAAAKNDLGNLNMFKWTDMFLKTHSLC